MSYIEIKKGKNQNYAYYIKKFTFLGKQYKINNYIGKQELIKKEQYILENLNELTNQEFMIKKPFFPNNLIYSQTIIPNIEKKAIKIHNLLDAINHPTIELEMLQKFVYNSNNIEGSHLSESELKKIFENKKLTYFNKNEITEAQNSIKAYKYLKEEFNFSIRGIKKLYQILTKNLLMETGDPYPKGFRKKEILVGNEPTINFEEILPSLKNLLKWYKKNKTNYPLILAFDFHLRYEHIHPFRDSNGRTGRLIMNKILMNNNYPLMLVFKENKNAYFNTIKKGINGYNKSYYEFMLEQQLKSYTLMEKLIQKK